MLSIGLSLDICYTGGSQGSAIPLDAIFFNDMPLVYDAQFLIYE